MIIIIKNLILSRQTIAIASVLLIPSMDVSQIYLFFHFRDHHGIATRKDKILSVIMIVLAVFSNIIAIYSNAYSLLT